MNPWTFATAVGGCIASIVAWIIWLKSGAHAAKDAFEASKKLRTALKEMTSAPRSPIITEYTTLELQQLTSEFELRVQLSQKIRVPWVPLILTVVGLGGLFALHSEYVNRRDNELTPEIQARLDDLRRRMGNIDDLQDLRKHLKDLDIVFLLDQTSSMRPFLESAELAVLTLEIDALKSRIKRLEQSERQVRSERTPTTKDSTNRD